MTKQEIERLLRPVRIEFGSFGEFKDSVLYMKQNGNFGDDVVCSIINCDMVFTKTQNPYATEAEYEKGRE